MKPGLKVNADPESFERLSQANPALAEVWFNASNPDSYTDLFDELIRRKCDVGLHFWGILDGNILPNLAYPDATVIDRTIKLMKRTIDTASSRGFQYVNIHPGSAALLRVDYTAQRYDIDRDPVDTDRAIGIFLENAAELSAYAQQKNVVFTVETVPPNITDGWYDAGARLRPKRSYELPARAIIQAAHAGISIANDFTHTAANIISGDPNAVWTFLFGTTMALAPCTRLIHLGFIVPPYNGTDNHDTFTNPVFHTTDAVPNYDQTIDLLRIFKDRDDVWILAEPKDNHAENYMEIRAILEKL